MPICSKHDPIKDFSKGKWRKEVSLQAHLNHARILSLTLGKKNNVATLFISFFPQS
jgi:hypothetical protein